jgi:hypothetical protein
MRKRCSAGETEIGELRIAGAAHEDVSGLDVAMQDARRVRSREGVRDTDQQVDDLPPRARFNSGPILECAAVD